MPAQTYAVIDLVADELQLYWLEWFRELPEVGRLQWVRCGALRLELAVPRLRSDYIVSLQAVVDFVRFADILAQPTDIIHLVHEAHLVTELLGVALVLCAFYVLRHQAKARLLRPPSCGLAYFVTVCR